MSITIKERFIMEHKNAMDQKLKEAYKKSAQEDAVLVKDWDVVSGDRVD